MWDEGLEIARRLRDWEAGKAPGPYTLELYPTLRCNMRCVYCDTRFRNEQRPDTLSPRDLERIVDEAAALGVRRIMLLGGGEPLLAGSTTESLMRRIKAAGMEGVLTTNGWLLDAALAETLVEVGWDEVQVSLDAADPDTNDTLRGTPGALARVTANLRRLAVLRHLAGAKSPRILLHTVLTRRNVDQLERLVALAGSLGAYRINVDALIAYRPEQRELLLTDEQRQQLPSRVAAARRIARDLGIEHSLEQLVERRTTERGQMELPLGGPATIAHAPCLNPWYYMVVDADGCVSPCCVITGTGEDVRVRGLRASWEKGPVLDGLRGRLLRKQVPDRCRECSVAMISRNEELRPMMVDR